jgi:hypothetical protein
MQAVPFATRRWKIGSTGRLTGIIAVVLAFGTGCADIWGFDDLKEGPGEADASDAGKPDAPGIDAMTGSGDNEGGSLCIASGSIVGCGGCNAACDTTRSNVISCMDNARCTYAGCRAGWLDCDSTDPNTDGCETSITSPASCGACGAACDTKNSLGATCVALPDGGVTCQYTGCKPGFGDCDETAPDTDGCETLLNTTTNCAGCRNACDTTHSQQASCDGKTCSYKGCNPGFGDCMATAPDLDGCETAVPTNSCNACGSGCDTTHSNSTGCNTTATPVCTYSTCQPGWKDCNTTPPDTNGCETQITTPANCGDCGRACDMTTSTGATCASGNCSYVGCASGFADCDMTAPNTNGCESSLSSTTSCGGCGNKCNTATGPASCDGTKCSYKCNTGLLDCNAGTGADVDGCECATPMCCGSSCETIHSNGIGPYYDCDPKKTYDVKHATEACEAYAGAGQCQASSLCCGLLGSCILSNTAQSVCGSVQGKCVCWQYAGPAPGTVQVIGSGKCTAACGSTTDTTWN